MTGRNLLGAVLVPFVLLGCNGGGSNKPVTQDDFCTQLAAAECQVANTCVVSADACKLARKANCTAFAANALASGTRMFNAGNVGNCVNAAMSLYGNTAPITPSQLSSTADTCNYVFQGMAKSLEMCTSNYDCADKSQICDKGRCAAKVTKNANDLCSNPGEVCSTGLFCTTVSGVMQCAAKGASGAACSATAPCLEMLRCSNGTCMDRVAAQGSCDPLGDDCASAAPFCDPAAGNKCDPGLSFSASSASCCAFGLTGATCSTGTGGAGRRAARQSVPARRARGPGPR